MTVPTFSFSPEGVWSKRQLDRVLEVLQPEARAAGLELVAFDVSSHGDDVTWCVLRVRCTRHEEPLPCRFCDAEDEAREANRGAR